MTAYARRVRRLTVRAPGEAIARRVAIHLEDALRTASLPGADSARLVVIRSLRLPRIAAGMSPLQLAVAIEQRLWQLGSSAVHALDPAAAQAAVVYFADAAEAHTQLALRLSSSIVPGEWFWRAAVPDWNPSHSRDEALRSVLESIARLEGAPVVAAAFVQALARAGTADVLCGALRGDGARRWAMAFGGAPARAPAPLETTPALVPLLRRWVAAWGSADPRSTWLAAIALVAARPARAGDPALRAHARSVARHCADRAVGIGPERALVLAHPEGGRPVDTRSASHARPAVHVDNTSGNEMPAGDAPARAAFARPQVAAERQASESSPVTPGRAARAERHDWHRTQAGGLLFLLQPLRRLGIAEALTTGAALPADLAARVLASVAARAGVDAEDPVWSILQVQADESSPVPFGDGYLGGAGYAVHVWVAALRRWCRRHAGVGLRALVRRSAHVRWTGAHVDVQFDPNSVDVRLRRAGLDVDPGWTPWFGRVVRFHYDGRP